jgi:hypothetical protein
VAASRRLPHASFEPAIIGKPLLRQPQTELAGAIEGAGHALAAHQPGRDVIEGRQKSIDMTFGVHC